MKEYAKLDADRLQIRETVEKDMTTDYLYRDLVAIRDALVAEKKAYDTQKDLEIADANEAIAQAENLGVSTNTDPNPIP